MPGPMVDPPMGNSCMRLRRNESSKGARGHGQAEPQEESTFSLSSMVIPVLPVPFRFHRLLSSPDNR